MRDWKRYLREHLSLPSMKGHRDERALEEMADHLGDLYEEARVRGATEEEAEALVLQRLGDPERAAAELMSAEPRHIQAEVERRLDRREEEMLARGGLAARLGDGLRDLRLGLRGLARRPQFAGVVILVLGLGIGATTAIFTLVDAILLSPLPFDHADRLVAIHHAAPAWGMADARQCAAWHFTYEDESRVFTELGMYGRGRSLVTGRGAPEAVPALRVTEGVLRVLGTRPIAGRDFNRADMDPDGPPTIMLGQGYWRSRFGGDPSVIGQTLQVDGLAREIIGVAPDELQALGSPEPSLIVPLRFRQSALFVGNIGYGSVGRLRDDVSLEQAAADLNRVLPLAWEKFPGGPVASSSDPHSFRAEVHLLKQDLVGSVADLLWTLLAGVALVLLIAWANVANLMLVRADGKEGEMCVRAALGASGRRITWEYLKESLLLGIAGGAVGLVLAEIGLRTLLTLAPADIPRLEEVTMSGAVLLFTLLLSLTIGCLLGITPALRQGRNKLAETLKGAGRSGTEDRGRRRIRDFSAMGQMALALVLLVASGLLFRSFLALRHVDPGFRQPEGVLVVRLYIPPQEIQDPAQVADAYEAMVHRVAKIPGVTSVGLATTLPMDGNVNYNPFYVRDRAAAPHEGRISRRHKWVGPGYFETLHIPLLAGRSFTWDEIHQRAPVAMLSERLARETFGSPEAALGQYVAARPDPPVWKRVVGVAKDVREDGLGQDPPPLVYWPQVTLAFWEGDPPDDVQTWRDAGLAIRSDRVGTPGFRDELQRAIWEINPNLPFLRAKTLPELMDASMARTSFVMILLGVAGGVALLLGLVGVYGVIAYAVTQRTREIGIRMALGAGRRRILTLVVGEGALIGGAGVVLGLVLAAGVTRFMTSFLFAVSPVDGATYAAVAIALFAVALLAAYLPARRAARLEPSRALREE